METEETQKILSEISERLEESEALHQEIKRLNKMTQEILMERISTLEFAMQEFVYNYPKNDWQYYQNHLYAKFKNLLTNKNEKESNKF